MARSRPQSRHDLHWKKRRQVPDAQIVGAADQYMSAYELLRKEPPGSGVLLPEMSCAAIAIELYLKSLAAERIYTPDADMPEASIVTAYPDVTGHVLAEMHGAISGDLRSSLDKRFKEAAGEDFATVLDRIEGAFAAARYPYEPVIKRVDNFKLRDFENVARFLQSFVGSLPVRETIEWQS